MKPEEAQTDFVNEADQVVAPLRVAHFVDDDSGELTLGQQSGIIADWAIQNGSKRVVSIFSDFAPGAEAAKVFEQHFTKGGGQVLETLKVPLSNPDFAPFLQRARDHQPDTLFVFLPAGQAAPFARQFVERGLDKTGIKLIGTGDIVSSRLPARWARKMTVQLT